jgi:hypothetical protein
MGKDTITMLSVLEQIKAKSFLRFDKLRIDNAVFRLHSMVTVLFLLVASLLVTTQQFIGDPIDCVVFELPQSVMDTYCWIHSTFTLPNRITAAVKTRARLATLLNDYF